MNAEEERAAWLRLRLQLSRYIEAGDQSDPPFSPLQGALLMTLREAQSRGTRLNQTQLARLLHSDDSTISEAVNDLENMGLCAVPTSGRSNFPEVTDQGRKALLEYAQKQLGFPPEVLQGLTEMPEYQRIVPIFEKVLVEHLQTKIRMARAPN